MSALIKLSPRAWRAWVLIGLTIALRGVPVVAVDSGHPGTDV